MRRKTAHALTALWTVGLAAAVLVLSAAGFSGWRLRVVEGRSMDAVIPKFSLAAVTPASPALIAVGDVIVYREPANRSIEVMHRVIGVSVQPTGQRFFQTQGDHNATPDPVLIPSTDVVGELRFHVPWVGWLARIMRPPLGFVLLVVPTIASMLVRRLRGVAARGYTTTATALPTPLTVTVPAPAAEIGGVLKVVSKRLGRRPGPRERIVVHVVPDDRASGRSTSALDVEFVVTSPDRYT